MEARVFQVILDQLVHLSHTVDGIFEEIQEDLVFDSLLIHRPLVETVAP